MSRVSSGSGTVIGAGCAPFGKVAAYILSGICGCDVADVAPQPFVNLIPIGNGEEGQDDDDEGLFRVEFGMLDPDACTPTSCTVELVCGTLRVLVELDQIVEIERDDEGCEIEFEDGILEVVCINSVGETTTTAEPVGLAPDNDDEDGTDD